MKPFAVLLLLVCIFSGMHSPVHAQQRDAGIQPFIFISERGSRGEIYIQEASGEVVQVTNNGLYKHDLVVSPDGKQILYTAGKSAGSYFSIYSVLSDGSNDHLILDARSYITGLGWSHQGDKIAFSNFNGIYVLDPAFTHVDVIYSSDNQEYIGFGAWSPDGSQMLFDADRKGIHQIFIMNADGTNVRQLTSVHDKDTYVACEDWSPDGQQIAFHSGSKLNVSDIYVMNVDGTEIQRFTKNDVRSNCPLWSPDGTLLMFNTFKFDEWKSRIYVIGRDGSNLHQLTNGDGYAWLPQPEVVPAAS